MENWIWWLLAIPVVWFITAIVYQIGKLFHLWVGLKMSEIKERIDL